MWVCMWLVAKLECEGCERRKSRMKDEKGFKWWI